MTQQKSLKPMLFSLRFDTVIVESQALKELRD